MLNNYWKFHEKNIQWFHRNCRIRRGTFSSHILYIAYRPHPVYRLLNCIDVGKCVVFKSVPFSEDKFTVLRFISKTAVDSCNSCSIEALCREAAHRLF